MVFRASSTELGRRARNRATLKALGIDPNLCDHFGGILIGRDDQPEYDKERAEANPAFDAYPSLIAQCTNQRDIRLVLDIARAGKLPPICRSGGHSTAGYSVQDGCIVIDLGQMTHVRVFPRQRTALIEAGTPFRHVNAVLDSYGLHVPGGACVEVCIGGYMQGGGYGFTSRTFGMNSDNVQSIRMMLADGRIVKASREQNYDLFWAARGGTGNNFGVLLDVEYKLHKIRPLVGFGLMWHLKDAPAALVELQKNYMRNSPTSKLGYMLAFTTVKGQKTFLMRGMFNGSAREAQGLIGRIAAQTGGRQQFIEVATYNKLERTLMETYQIDPDLPDGAKEDKQAGYIDRTLTLQDWQAIVDTVATADVPPNFVVIEPYGGRINEISASDSAFVHRTVDMDFYVDVFWVADSAKPAAVAWLDRFMELMKPHFNGKVYQNYPRAIFKDYPLNYWGIDCYTELCAIKKKYDCGNFFTFPQAIGRWPGFTPSRGIGDRKLTAAIHNQHIAVEI